MEKTAIEAVKNHLDAERAANLLYVDNKHNIFLLQMVNLQPSWEWVKARYTIEDERRNYMRSLTEIWEDELSRKIPISNVDDAKRMILRHILISIVHDLDAAFKAHVGRREAYFIRGLKFHLRYETPEGIVVKSPRFIRSADIKEENPDPKMLAQDAIKKAVIEFV